jgi:hypothetical protein
VVVAGFVAIAQCRHDAVGLTRDGKSWPIHLSDANTSARDAVVWVMTQPGWTCSYALAAVLESGFVPIQRDAQPGFPMADWAAKRRAQISTA